MYRMSVWHVILKTLQILECEYNVLFIVMGPIEHGSWEELTFFSRDLDLTFQPMGKIKQHRQSDKGPNLFKRRMYVIF